MTKLEWIKNNRGNNLGQDYDRYMYFSSKRLTSTLRQFLEDIYTRISAERFKLNDEDVVEPTENNSTKSQKSDKILSKKFHLYDEDLMVIKGKQAS
jgi:hypothetical protein